MMMGCVWGGCCSVGNLEHPATHQEPQAYRCCLPFEQQRMP